MSLNCLELSVLVETLAIRTCKEDNRKASKQVLGYTAAAKLTVIYKAD